MGFEPGFNGIQNRKKMLAGSGRERVAVAAARQKETDGWQWQWHADGSSTMQMAAAQCAAAICRDDGSGTLFDLGLFDLGLFDLGLFDAPGRCRCQSRPFMQIIHFSHDVLMMFDTKFIVLGTPC